MGDNTNLREEGKARAKKIAAFQNVFNSPDGRLVLDDLMNYCHLLRPTYSKEDERSMFINEGRREAVLYILEMTKIDLKKLHAIISGQEGDIYETEINHIE